MSFPRTSHGGTFSSNYHIIPTRNTHPFCSPRLRALQQVVPGGCKDALCFASATMWICDEGTAVRLIKLRRAADLNL